MVKKIYPNIMINFIRIIKFLGVLFAISAAIILLSSRFATTDSPNFSDVIAIFSLVATLLGTFYIVTSVDDWKIQEDGKTKKETAILLSETIENQYIGFINTASYFINTPARTDSFKYFHYKHYDSITPARYNIIADEIIKLANRTHQIKIYYSRLLSLIKGNDFKEIFEPFRNTADALYLDLKFFFDHKVVHPTLDIPQNELEAYKAKYNQLSKLLVQLTDEKKELDDYLFNLISLRKS